MRYLFIIAVLTFFSTFLDASVIYVPDGQPTIQGAINAATSGDTIVVRTGTYIESIDFYGKSLTVTSESGPKLTVIRGDNSGAVVSFQNGESLGAVLEGFTVVNGSGSGIVCWKSSPTITKNIVIGNGSSSGGGVFCVENASPVISFNYISGNTSVISGGGIACWDNCSPHIHDNWIVGNNGGIIGGGVSCELSSPAKIEYNKIIGNIVSTCGGGVACLDSSVAVIAKNLIRDNEVLVQPSTHGGGGVYCNGSDPIVTCNVIENNTSFSGGGVYFRDYSNLIFVNNAVFENVAEYGGGIYSVAQFDPIIVNNTIVANEAKVCGGGFSGYRSWPKIINTIFWENTAPNDPEISVTSGTPVFSFCDIKGGWPGIGNIDDNPLFAGSTSKDYHLTQQSPCRNAGDNATVFEIYDFEGDPRIVGTVDMGADEFYYHLYSIGDVLPGSPIDIKVVGIPGLFTRLALGAGMQDPPQSTPHGDLWLKFPFAKSWQLGPIPSTGILTHTATVPSGWVSGSEHPFQALVGPWGGSSSKLTNLMTLVVVAP